MNRLILNLTLTLGLFVSLHTIIKEKYPEQDQQKSSHEQSTTGEGAAGEEAEFDSKITESIDIPDKTKKEREFDCMARNIFYEAGVEHYRGKIAVAQVTYNRIGMRKHWESICKVVYAPAQFSWTLDQTKRYTKPYGPLWEESKKAAKDFFDGMRIPELEKSDHYHATYIKKPTWAYRMTKIKTIGQHAFYTSATDRHEN